MAPRATWKGFLTFGELSCAVSLHAAVSTAERISFHMVDRRTGHAARRRFVDEETGAVVERDAQVKGYETSSGNHVLIEPEEIAAAQPASDKSLALEGFIACADVDPLYFDRPYFLAPADAASGPLFALLREAMEESGVAALAHAVLFRRARTLLLRPYEETMIATTLHFAGQVRAEADAFSGIEEIDVSGEMLELAEHIIDTKRGTVDPRTFEDRYEAALADLVERKLAGKPLPRVAPQKSAKVVNLLDALRRSAGKDGAASDTKKKPAAKTSARKGTAKAPASRPASRRKAG